MNSDEEVFGGLFATNPAPDYCIIFYLAAPSISKLRLGFNDFFMLDRRPV